MKIDLLFLTYNRLPYTKLALNSVLADPAEQFSLTIWDNASDDGTVEYLKTEVKDPRIKEIVFSPRNVGQTAALNEVWSKSNAELLGKLDNDCIVTPGWTRTLGAAHQEIAELGVVACWHFFSDDFNYQVAKPKIHRFGRHQIFRHPWTCGTGLLFKRKTFEQFGPIREKATTEYWLKMAREGYINGFYYPLILQEHMDDPRSPHNVRNSGASVSFSEAYKHSYGFQTGAIRDEDSHRRIHGKILRKLICGPWEPEYYCGPRWKRLWGRMITFMNGRRHGFST